MKSALDLGNPTASSKEARHATSSALDALHDWRNDVLSANDRCLTKILDHMAAAQNATGWPEQVSASARDCALKASRLQTQLIDRALASWEELLKPAGAPADWTRGGKSQPPRTSRPTLHDAMPGSMQFGEMWTAPLRAWMQAADMWQRRWMATIPGEGTHPGSVTTAKKGRRARS